jgi:hypothetical protein
MTVLELLVKAIKTDLALTDQQIFIFNQEIPPQKDPGLYVSLQLLGCKTYSNSKEYRYDPVLNKYWCDQSHNKLEVIQINVYSKTMEAMQRYDEVVASLNGYTATDLCTANGIKLQIQPHNAVVNIVNGATIPYRHIITLHAFSGFNVSREVPVYDHGFLPLDIKSNN